MSTGLIVVGIIVLLVIIVLLRTVRIVPQAFVGVVERLGRYSRTLPPASTCCSRSSTICARSSTCASRSSRSRRSR